MEQAIPPPLLRDVVTQSVAEAIVRGELAPGGRVSEVQLAAQLGVSRHPVHEALRLLATEGLVIDERRQGWIVAPINATEAAAFCDCRILLEAECAKLAAEHLSDGHHRTLTTVFGELEQAAARLSLHEYLQAVTHFHQTYQAACPNAVLVEIISGMTRRSIRFRSVAIREPGRVAQSLENHRALLGAFGARDASAAATLIRRALEESKAAILRAINRQQAPLLRAATNRPTV
jgi:DNA-binding GntR family transcriptional regulator